GLPLVHRDAVDGRRRAPVVLAQQVLGHGVLLVRRRPCRPDALLGRSRRRVLDIVLGNFATRTRRAGRPTPGAPRRPARRPPCTPRRRAWWAAGRCRRRARPGGRGGWDRRSGRRRATPR